MYGACNVGCKNHDVGQTSRSDRRDRRAVRCILRSDPPLFVDANRLLVWRGLFTDTNFDEQSVRIPEPYSVGLEARRRVNLANIARLQLFAKPRKVIGECAKGQIGQFLLRTFNKSAPAVRGTMRHDGQNIALGSNVQAERRIEPLSVLQGRHHQIEVVDRMNPKLAGSPRWSDMAFYLSHARIPPSSSIGIIAV